MLIYRKIEEYLALHSIIKKMDCERAKISMFLLTAPSSGVNTMSKFT